MSVRTAERGRSGQDERGYEEPGWLGRIAARLEPEEGWISLLLVALLAGVMAWSIADSRWILGRDNLTGFVIWLAVAAALWGYLSARLDMSPWLAHLLGAAIGAFLIIEAVGAEMPGAQPGLVGWFNATAESVTEAYLDLTWRHQISTSQYGHFCLLIGILVWGTVQAASYDIFGYHRAVTGVLLMAALLVANMSLTYTDQFWGLVLFSAASLALLLQAHAAEERSSWLRHRIWRGGDFKAPHLEGGLGFASLAVCGALILTSVASSAPLASASSNLDPVFRELATWIGDYLPVGGQSRITTGSDFGSSVTIGTSFRAGPDKVFTVRLPDQVRSSKWRVAAYDEFKSTGWTMGPQTKQTSITAGTALTSGTSDQVTAQTPGRLEFRYVVHIQDTSLKHMVVANEPISASVAVERVVLGSNVDRSIVWYPTSAQDYTVTASIPDLDPAGKGLTEWRLIHAGTQWPAGLLARYTQGTDFVHEDGRRLLQEIKDEARLQGYTIDPNTGRFANEFEAAKAIQDYLRSARFVYSTDISDRISGCVGLSTVDCFDLVREGFCEQYATTMTMLMRLDGFPARYVVGFLPGTLEQYTLISQVTARQRHAWVEVFFPGYGWIPFDPTGAGVGDPTLLPVGNAVLPTPTPSAVVGPDGSARPRSTIGEPEGNDGTGGTTSDGGGFGGPLAPLLPLIPPMGLLALVLLFWSRRPRRPQAPDSVYRGIVRLASRLGLKPHPNQTVYEYTGMLADIVPGARDPLGVVATAEVEVTYGKRSLSEDRLVTLQAAENRVRAALLRLLVRLPGRGPRTAGRKRGKAAGRRG